MKLFFGPDPERMRLKGDLNGLFRLLDSKHETALRIEAILALGRMKTPAAVNHLINLFMDTDYNIRNAASRSLVNIGSDVINPLIKALSTCDEQTGRMIHTTLTSMGDEAAREIVNNIHLLQGIGYERAGYILNSMGIRVMPVLIDSYGTQDQTTVRFIEGLFETFGRSAIQPIINGLSYDNEEIRARLSAYLIILGNQVVGDLLNSCGQDEEWLRELKFFIISEIGKPALDSLYLALKDPNPVTSSMAQKAFLEFGESAIVPLISGLYDTDYEIRKVSENSLTRIGEPIIPHLLEEMAMCSETDREPIISVIQQIGEPAVPYLIETLNKSKDERSKQMVQVLSRMGAVTIPSLINSVQDQADTSALKDAFLSMGRIAFPFLEEASERERGKTAAFSIDLLRQIDPVRSIEPMITALYHADREVRETALENLVGSGEIAVPRLIQVLGSGDEEAVDLARIALVKNGEAAVPHLVDSLSDPMGANHSLIQEILQENEVTALPYLIPFMEPEKEGHDEAMALIKKVGADATSSLLHAIPDSGPGLVNAIKNYLTELFNQDPHQFITKLFSGQIPDTGLMFELVHSSPDIVIPHLIDIFQEDDGSRSLVAGELLSRFGKDALPPFINALRNETDDDRKLEITSFLIKIGDDAIPELVAELGDEEIAPYSMAALSAIGESAIPALLPLLKSSDQVTQQYTIHTLTGIGTPAAAALMSLMQEDDGLVPLISRILAGMGGSALPELIQELEILQSSGQEGSSRGIALMSLITEITLSNRDDMRQLFSIENPKLIAMFERIFISKGEQILTPLLDAVMYEQAVPDMVANIIISMQSQTQSAVTTLLKSVGPGDRRRIALLKVLGILNDPASAPVLYEALNDPDPDIRMVAIRELGKFGREALEPLTDAMKDPDPLVRAAAVESLGDIGLPVLDQLITALKDHDGAIRAAALKGISKIGEPGQFMLVQTLDDKDRKVRNAVVKLLEDTGWEPKYTTDRLSYLFAKEQFEDLIKLGPPSIDTLARGTHDDDPEIRDKSREALAVIRDSIQT
ncbi:HEAT repeat domain-containing protein [Methanospirillum sp.]|uniref:HEAT repeat domain-containing protein n=1 Tax=Methanospirillum sp. TaxID=45200 RepID=UPI0035A0FD82